jgi:hypothetical protein
MNKKKKKSNGWMLYLWMETLTGLNVVSDETEFMLDKLRDIVYTHGKVNVYGDKTEQELFEVPMKWAGWYIETLSYRY